MYFSLFSTPTHLSKIFSPKFIPKTSLQKLQIKGKSLKWQVHNKYCYQWKTSKIFSLEKRQGYNAHSFSKFFQSQLGQLDEKTNKKHLYEKEKWICADNIIICTEFPKVPTEIPIKSNEALLFSS